MIEWVDPPFAAGHWKPDLISAAGGEPVAARVGQRSAATRWAAIESATPEVVVVAPCGYHLPGAIEQARGVAEALPGVPVWAIDADGLVVRAGPRLTARLRNSANGERRPASDLRLQEDASGEPTDSARPSIPAGAWR